VPAELLIVELTNENMQNLNGRLIASTVRCLPLLALKNYPENIANKLGFDQIQQKVIHYCEGPLAKELVVQAKFTSQYKKLKLWLDQSAEWLQLLEDELKVPDGHFLDIGPLLSRLSIDGVFLDEEEFHDIRLALKTIASYCRFFQKHAESYPSLAELLKDIPALATLIRAIDEVLDAEGLMRSNASSELAKLNKEVFSIEKDLNRTAFVLFKKAKEAGWVSDTDISVREGRLVLPILSEHKRKVKGIVHDESGSGQILYIEPEAIIELNNHLRELQLERRREVERILRELSKRFAPEAEQLIQYNKRVSILDFIRAKALFAHEIKGHVPKLVKGGQLNWLNARHPLLEIHVRQTTGSVVPLNLVLEEDERILVISGPNAGGKSVAMKTIGLLQYMVQCGFPVPAEPESQVGIFKQLFIDIGDEQSLDNDLSTYSSHLTNMKHFVEHANKDTLYLIDEFGTGTDPQFGGPMAESILYALLKKGAYGVVTTHYSNLKLMADRFPEMLNAAMAYDTNKLQPLYRLETGKPGSSFAFEVASKIGLPKQVIQAAKKKVGSKQRNVDELLLNLEKEKRELEEQLIKAKSEEAHYERLRTDYEALKTSLDSRKKEIIQRAKEEAFQILKNSNSLVERTVREIKESGKESITTGRKRITETRTKIEKELKKGAEEKPQEELEIGCRVKISGQEAVGRLLGLHNKKATVEFGQMRTQVDIKKLERVSRKEERQLSQHTKGYSGMDQMEEFKMDLDVRGKRGDEAVKEVIRFLDRAIIMGFDQLRILHGKGDGILRQLIRKELRDFPAVEQMEDEHIERGGSGITLVYLK